MIQAACRAEFDYYQKPRAVGPDRFMPTADPVIRSMLEAAVKQFDLPAATRTGSIIVEAISREDNQVLHQPASTTVAGD